MNMNPLRIGIQQRVLPAYRADFFDLLAETYNGSVSVFSGETRQDEALGELAKLKIAEQYEADNLHFFQKNAYLCYQRGILKWLKTWDPNVLIMEANPRYLSALPAISWMHSRKRPVIGWGLGAPKQSASKFTFADTFRRTFVNQFDYLITYSEQGKMEYQTLGTSPSRVFVASNSVARKPMYPLPSRTADHFKDGKAIILFVGRLQARKKLETLFQACAALPEEIQPKIWIVGDGPEREYFEVLAAAMYPDVTFLGALFGIDLEPIYKQADLFVLPGTGGLAVQQAMSFGLPVIVGEADGTQSVLVREENGWIIPADADYTAFTQILEKALRSPELLRQMGQASFSIVSEEVNLEHMVSVFQNVITNALGETK
ncbi:MAG: glycosyltransferase family 4 protein [Anaerolineaceae bacterium]|nr:glycosyltransferase family 4 protein [Anaerolineaceae bacterium]